jgi:hypothetical protein
VIVRQTERGAVLITQPGHAHLAGRIMEHCVALVDHPRRRSILLACAEHDGGWIEPDNDPRVDPSTGRVVDFMTAPASIKQAVWPRAIARLDDDPWAAALVAQHAITVYGRLRDDPEWLSFFVQMAAARDRLAEKSGQTPADLEADYPFVRLSDLISLTFCNAWTERQSFGPWTVYGTGTHVVVTPNPFGAQVDFAIEATQLASGTFTTDQELRAALASGQVITLAGSVGK